MGWVATNLEYFRISARLRGLDEETLEVIEDTEILTGKFAEATKTINNPGGISLFTDASKQTFKSTYQIIKELSTIWNDLSDKQHAKIEDIVGGKRQLQIVAASISNFKAAEKALDDMANSAGSAEAELATYQESAEYLFNQFKETFTSIAQHSVKRDDLKNLIGFGTSMLEIVDGIVSKIGLLPTILTTVVGIISSKKAIKHNFLGFNIDSNGKFESKFLGARVGKGWKQNVFGNTNEIKEATKAINDFHTAFQNGTMTQAQYNSALNHSNSIVRQYVQDIRSGTTESKAHTTAAKALNTELKNTGVSGKMASVGLKAAEVGVKALNTVVSIGLSLLVSYTLNTIIKGIDSAIHYTENLKKDLKELNNEYENIKTEIEDVNTKLSETCVKISELEKLPNLTLLDRDELDALRSYNAELERQKRMRENEERANRAKAREKALQLHEGMTVEKNSKWQWFDFIPIVGGITKIIDVSGDISNKNKHGFLWQQKKDLDAYKDALEELNELTKSEEYLNGNENAEQKAEELQSVIDDLDKKMKSAYEGWNEIYTGLKDSAVPKERALAEEYKTLMDKWDNIFIKNYQTFTEVIESSDFSVVIDQLKKLWSAGKLTSEDFKNMTEADVEGITEFKEALESVGATDTDEILEGLIRFFEKTKDKAEESAKSVKSFAEELKGLEDVINDAVSKFEKLTDAFKKTRLSGTLSEKEVLDLIQEMPDLAQYVKEKNGKYTITNEGFGNQSQKINQKLIDDITKKMGDVEEQIWLVNERNAVLEQKNNLYDRLNKAWAKDTNSDESKEIERHIKNVNEYLDELNSKINSSENSDSIDELNKAYEGLLTTLNLVNGTHSKLESELEGINDRFEDAKSEISEYNNEIETLDSAIKSLNEGNLLSYEEMNAIVEIAPELQRGFVQQEHGYSIATSALEEWRKKSYETRNSYIGDLLAMAEYERSKLAGQGGANIEKRIAALDAYINKLKALEQEITYEEDESVSDELQNQIDKYNTIIDAIKIVRDQYSEAIDSEIEALEDSKDALKEANDERQREIDLREAIINLENAKKRKVWVFSNSGGFQQVQDKGAIKEAEEKYRDLITDIQEDAIDKQIEERKKLQDAWNEETDRITGAEQDIQDAMTVRQALKQLGLSSEKDLAALPESTLRGISDKLADAMVRKENEDNKENPEYKPVTLDDILKSMGAGVTAEEFKRASSDLPTLNEYNLAKTFADELKKQREDMVSSVVNNSGNVFSPNIYVTTQSEKDIAGEVEKTMEKVFTQFCNTIK